MKKVVHMGRRPRWRESLVPRMKSLNWRRRGVPYLVTSAGLVRFAPRDGKTDVWIGGPLLKTQFRLRGLLK